MPSDKNSSQIVSISGRQPAQRADLLVHSGFVVTMDPQRRVFGNGAIAVRDGAIVDVGSAAELSNRWNAQQRLDMRGQVILPGLINAHVHITGLDLFPGLEPAESPLTEHLSRWALPAHEHSTPEDERATARYLGVQLLHQGITAFIEAATIRYPEAVLDGLSELQLRGAIGTWTWDGWPEPAAFATPTEQAIRRMCAALEAPNPNPRIAVWPSIIGHTACSDELSRAAADAARQRNLHWTFHMSPGTGDGDAFRARTGRDPLVYLRELGVLDERAVVAHAIHISDAEVAALNSSDATVAFCPASNLHLASGLTHAGRHPELRHVALGTDSPHNLHLLQAAGLACALFGDRYADRARVPAERALEWLTLEGARALGRQADLGSIEVGKRADLAVFDVSRPVYNIANALVHHAASGRASHVFIDGKHVIRDGQLAFGDQSTILREAELAGRRVAERAGLPRQTGWPITFGEDM